MGLIVKFPMECCPFGQQTNIETILQSAIFLCGFFMIFHREVILLYYLCNTNY